jgi:hypothetical protein
MRTVRPVISKESTITIFIFGDDKAIIGNTVIGNNYFKRINVPL